MYNEFMQSLQELIIGTTIFIDNVLLPLFFGIALLFFVWNAVKFFIIGAGETDAKENAKRLALYGIGAFVILVSLWGIVNLLVSGLGWGNSSAVTPDYMMNDSRQGGWGFYFEFGSDYRDPIEEENARQADYCSRNPMSLDCK